MSWDDIIRPDLEPLVPYAPGLRASQVRERSGRSVVLKLSSNEHPCGPVPAAIAAMKAVLPQMNRYPDGSASALRRKLADRHGVPVQQVAVTNGSNELLRLVAHVVVRPGDEIVYPWPSFVVYPMVASIFGATHVRVGLDDGGACDLDAILAAITERTRVVFLCNPNNPTGAIYGREAFARFMEHVPPHVVVVADEAYFEFVIADEYPNALDWFDGERPLVVTRTFSKIYSLAGLRIGYGFMPEPLVRAIDKVREPFNVNTVAQIAAYYSLDDEAEVQRRRAENQEQKVYLYSCFDRLGVSYVRSEANFVYFKTERPVEVFQALLEEGVIVRDFGSAPALRLGIGTPEDTMLTIAAFEAVAVRLGAF
ncbi:MAG: histidinol-phosphate transaminase [Coriobacteriia bacterium]|nr:histidinol-phosphate transaminase [Coriobacteriia bacterium]